MFRYLFAGMLLLTGTSATADTDLGPIILDEPPLPDGFVPAKFKEMRNGPQIPLHLQRSAPKHYFACFGVDIGADGLIKRAAILQSSGDAELDADDFVHIAGTVYEPATLNGVPIAERHLAMVLTRVGKFDQDDPDFKCDKGLLTAPPQHQMPPISPPAPNTPPQPAHP